MEAKIATKNICCFDCIFIKARDKETIACVLMKLKSNERRKQKRKQSVLADVQKYRFYRNTESTTRRKKNQRLHISWKLHNRLIYFYT